jgi:hypothetical protein
MLRPTFRFSMLLVILAVIGGATFAACSDPGPSGLFIDLQFRLRCIAMGGCVGFSDRNVLGYNGQDGLRLTCSVNETDANRTLTFSASGRDYGISMTNAVFARAGGSPSGTGCTLSVTDSMDGNTYMGICGASDPSEAQPCKVSGVTFGVDAPTGRPLISGNIYCQGISPSAAPGIDRELTGPGNTIDAQTSPVRFNLYDCAGFNPD